MKLIIPVLAILLVPSATAAQKPKHDRAGVYKNLRYVEESGDLLGMAVRIRVTPTPKIVVTSCEGGCFGGKEWPLRIRNNTIAFDICDDVVDQRGQRLPCKPVRYVGRFDRMGRLIVSVAGDSTTKVILTHVQRPKPREVENLACAGRSC